MSEAPAGVVARQMGEGAEGSIAPAGEEQVQGQPPQAAPQVDASPTPPAGKEGNLPPLSFSASPGPETFAAAMQEVQAAAREWGIQPDKIEGRFVSALMAGVGWSGRVSQLAQAEFKSLFKAQQDAAQLELARARELSKAVSTTLGQARSAMLNLQVERENVTARMIKETMPIVAAELGKVLSVRVKDEADALKFRRMMLSGVAAVALFLGGFGLRAWGDSGALAAIGNCLAHPLAGQGATQGHVYCDVTAFREASQ